MRRIVLTRNRHLEMIPIRLADASLTTSYAQNASEGKYICTVKKDAINAGHYYITLNDIPARTPVIIATAFHATLKLYAVLTSYSAGVIQIRCYDEAGTATIATGLNVILSASDLATED